MAIDSQESHSKDFLILHITRRCNQDCLFCCYPKLEKTLDAATAKRIITEESKRVGEIVFSGGEATLAPSLLESISFAKTIGLRTRLITNGILLARKGIAERLCQAGIDHVTISIQSLDPGIQETLTGTKGSLEALHTSIENLIALGRPPSIMTTLNRMNYKTLKAFYSGLSERYPPINSYIMILLEHVGSLRKNSWLHMSVSDLEPYLEEALDFLAEKGNSVDIDGIPFCYLGRHVNKATEYNQVKNGASYYVYDIETDRVIGGSFKDKLATLYQRTDACRVCKHRSLCPGVNKNYLSYMGDSEIYPVF